MMEVEEKSMIRAILEDVKSLKGRVEGMEGMLETLVEIYIDAFYEVKDEYLEKIDFLIWGITMKFTGKGTECFLRLHNLLCFISMK